MAKSNSTATLKELPAYVQDRNCRALAAGLIIEKQQRKGDTLSTVYSGLPEQFIAAGFIGEAEKFLDAVAAPTKGICGSHYGTRIFSPLESYHSGGFYRTASRQIRLTITREPMPSKEWVPAPGVNAYETIRDHELFGLCHVFIAKDVKDLIAMGINERVFEVKSEYENRHEAGFGDPRIMLWEWERDEKFDLIRFKTYPENDELYEESRRDSRRTPYKSPAEFREDLKERIDMAERLLQGETTTEAGFYYSLPDGDRGEIQRLLSEIEGIIEHSPIQVSKAEPRSAAWNAIQERYRKYHSRIQRIDAKYDSDFQSFMARAAGEASAQLSGEGSGKGNANDPR